MDIAEIVRTLITDANLLAAAFVAFAAGLVSFASPCVVPLVPGYVSYVAGLSGSDLEEEATEHRGRVLAGSLLFVVGFAVPFTMIGIAAGSLTFLQTSTVAQIVMGIVVAALGILMASGRLTSEWRITHQLPGRGVAAAPVLGFVFGVGWVPCVGPALGAIFTLAASVSGGATRGGVLAFIFALGLGLPFVLVAVLFHRASGALAWLRRNGRALQLAGGTLLVLTGVAIATGLWAVMIRWMRPLINGFTPPV